MVSRTLHAWLTEQMLQEDGQCNGESGEYGGERGAPELNEDDGSLDTDEDLHNMLGHLSTSINKQALLLARCMKLDEPDMIMDL